ncbi:MAG: hypothetical protein WCA01_01615 [Burkholderiales bacterium]|jgi:signal transduction histidine kinase
MSPLILRSVRAKMLAWSALSMLVSLRLHKAITRPLHEIADAARGAPVRRENGTIRGWVCVCTDVDARRRGEEETRQLLGVLLDLSRSRRIEQIAQFQ